MQLIQTCIKKGIADADQEARVFARKAFWSFSGHYPSIADSLLNSLDLKAQKLLQSGSQGAFGSVKSLKDGMTSNGGGGGGYHSNNGDFVDSSGGVYGNSNHRAGVSKYGGPSSVTSSQTNAALSAQMATPQSRIKRSTSAVDIKNSRSNSVISKYPGVRCSATHANTNNTMSTHLLDLLRAEKVTNANTTTTTHPNTKYTTATTPQQLIADTTNLTSPFNSEATCSSKLFDCEMSKTATVSPASTTLETTSDNDILAPSELDNNDLLLTRANNFSTTEDAPNQFDSLTSKSLLAISLPKPTADEQKASGNAP